MLHRMMRNVLLEFSERYTESSYALQRQITNVTHAALGRQSALHNVNPQLLDVTLYITNVTGLGICFYIPGEMILQGR